MPLDLIVPTSHAHVRDRLIGVLRVTLAATPSGFVVASERTDDPATRTAAKFSGWSAAVANFDALVSAAATVQA